MNLFFCVLCFFMFGRLWAGEGQREREREGENPKQAVQSLTQGSVSWTVRSWPELKSRAGCWTPWATQMPQGVNEFKGLYLISGRPHIPGLCLFVCLFVCFLVFTCRSQLSLEKSISLLTYGKEQEDNGKSVPLPTFKWSFGDRVSKSLSVYKEEDIL